MIKRRFAEAHNIVQSEWNWRATGKVNSFYTVQFNNNVRPRLNRNEEAEQRVKELIRQLNYQRYGIDLSNALFIVNNSDGKQNYLGHCSPDGNPIENGINLILPTTAKVRVLESRKLQDSTSDKPSRLVLVHSA